ncbi:MAG TPA: hypothetical protein VHP33_32855, partial [Polyangiaceae bacterium]|nr:hypothetical protein [Polyangiaceae bacterium]
IWSDPQSRAQDFTSHAKSFSKLETPPPAGVEGPSNPTRRRSLKACGGLGGLCEYVLQAYVPGGRVA